MPPRYCCDDGALDRRPAAVARLTGERGHEPAALRSPARMIRRGSPPSSAPWSAHHSKSCSASSYSSTASTTAGLSIRGSWPRNTHERERRRAPVPRHPDGRGCRAGAGRRSGRHARHASRARPERERPIAHGRHAGFASPVAGGPGIIRGMDEETGTRLPAGARRRRAPAPARVRRRRRGAQLQPRRRRGCTSPSPRSAARSARSSGSSAASCCRRSTHRVELTLAGSALLDRARELLRDLDEAIATTQSVGGELANRMATCGAPLADLVRRPAPTSRRCATPTRRCSRSSRRRRRSTVRPVNAGGVSSLLVSPRRPARRPPSSTCTAAATCVGSAFGYRPLAGALAARGRRRRARPRLPARARAPVPRRRSTTR